MGTKSYFGKILKEHKTDDRIMQQLRELWSLFTIKCDKIIPRSFMLWRKARHYVR